MASKGTLLLLPCALASLLAPDASAQSHFVPDDIFQAKPVALGYQGLPDAYPVRKDVELSVTYDRTGACPYALDPQGLGRAYRFVLSMTNLSNYEKRVAPKEVTVRTDGLGFTDAIRPDTNVYVLQPGDTKQLDWTRDCLHGKPASVNYQINIQTGQAKRAALSLAELITPYWDGNQYGFHNRRTHAVVVPARYDKVCAFSEGLAAVRPVGPNRSFGFINMQGAMVIPQQWYFLCDAGPRAPDGGLPGFFHNGKAWVCTNQTTSTCEYIEVHGNPVAPRRAAK